MSILGDLFSLKGLITATATLAFTIKSLHLTWNISKENVNVNGNNNIIIYNQKLAPAQKNFKLLWNLLAITVFLTYPFFGPTFNFSLKILAYIGTPIAACAVIMNCKGFGLSRIWDIFYVIGAVVVCWLAWCATPFLDYTASEAAPIYANFGAALNLISSGAPSLGNNYTVFRSITDPTISVFGFSLLFLSVLYLVFAFLSARSFDGALTFSGTHVVMAIVGYALACNFFLALFLQRFSYIKAIFIAPLQPFLNS